MERRVFVQSIAALGLSGGSSAQARGLRLGFDTYTLRGYGWKAPQFLDYAARRKLDTVQLSDLGDYESLDPAYLARIREQAARLGLAIDGGVSSLCPTSASYHKAYGAAVEYGLRGLRATAAVGSRVMRCFIGGAAERHGLAQHLESTLNVLRAVRTQALDLDVKIAIENHGDLHAWEMRDLIETAGKDFVGSCLDIGNAVAVFEDPLTALEALAPYVLTTHIRDSAVYEHPRGAAMQWVALGAGSVDLPRFFDRFREVCPGAAVQLEIVTGAPPHVLPYREPEFWNDFPKARAHEFARFLALVRPFKVQQQFDLERSFDYAKRTLHLGIRAHA